MGSVVATLAATLWRPPSGHYRIEEWHGLALGSVLVLLTASRLRCTGWWRGLLGWALVTAVVFRDAYGLAWLWLLTLAGLAVVGSTLEHDPDDARRALLVLGVVQIPLAISEWLSTSWYAQAGGGLAGSFGVRAGLSACWAACALVTTGWVSWGWVAATAATGGMVGLMPALGWRVWADAPRRFRPWLVVGLLGAGAAVAGARWSSRWWLWRQVWADGLEPVGFRPLRLGFLAEGAVDQLLGWRVYHNTLLESWGRFGGWGLGLVLVGGLTLWRRVTGPTRAWLLSVLTLHSLAMCPLLAWVAILMIASGGRHGLGSVSETPRPS